MGSAFGIFFVLSVGNMLNEKIAYINENAQEIIAASFDCRTVLYVGHNGEVYNRVSDSTIGTGIHVGRARVTGCLSPDGRKFAILLIDKGLQVWLGDSATGDKIIEHSKLAPYSAVALSNEMIAVAGAKGAVEVISFSDPTGAIVELKSSFGRIGCISISEKSTEVVWGTDSHIEMVRIGATKKIQLISADLHNGGRIAFVGFSIDGTMIVSCGRFDNKCVICNAETFKIIASFVLPFAPACAVFNKNGNKVFVGTYSIHKNATNSGRVYCYLLESGEFVETKMHPVDIIRNVSICTDSNVFVASGRNRLYLFRTSNVK